MARRCSQRMRTHACAKAKVDNTQQAGDGVVPLAFERQCRTNKAQGALLGSLASAQAFMARPTYGRSAGSIRKTGRLGLLKVVVIGDGHDGTAPARSRRPAGQN
jgi:hypothetical protein